MRHAKRIGLQRKRRRFRVRNLLKKHATRPRLTVFRSHQHIYAQVVDDAAGKTLVAASSREKDLHEAVGYGGNVAAAAAIGRAIAERALAAGLKQVYFDRREYRYHGRIGALADAARDAGLDLGAKPEVVVEEQPKAKKEKGAKKDKDAAAKPAGGKKEKKQKTEA